MKTSYLKSSVLMLVLVVATCFIFGSVKGNNTSSQYIVISSISDNLGDVRNDTGITIAYEYIDTVHAEVRQLTLNTLQFEMTMASPIPLVLPKYDLITCLWLIDTDMNYSTGQQHKFVGSEYNVRVQYRPESGWICGVDKTEPPYPPTSGTCQYSINNNTILMTISRNLIGNETRFNWEIQSFTTQYINGQIGGPETTLGYDNGDSYESCRVLLGNITLALSTHSIYRDQSITASGSISPSIGNISVLLTYIRPDGSTVSRKTMTSTDGKFIDTYAPDEYGEWSVKASFSWSEWAGESFLIQFTVKKETKLIVSTPTQIYVGNNTIITGYISPALSGVQIMIQITGPHNTTSYTTTQNGQFSLSYIPDRGGTYSVQAIFDGNAEYFESQSSVTTFDVQTIPTSLVLIVSPLTLYVGNSVVISGYISPSYSGFEIHVQIRGAEIVIENTTTQNGQFSDSFIPSTAGSYMVQAIYDGDLRHSGSQSSIISFEAKKITTSVTVSVSPSEGLIDVLTGSATTLTISGKISPSMSTTIQVFTGEGQQTVTSSNSGDFTLLFTPRNGGMHQIYVNYAGDDSHEMSTSNSIIVNIVQNYTTLIVLMAIIVAVVVVIVVVLTKRKIKSNKG